MDCERLAPLYEEYALGALEGTERAELEEHLARGCPKCTPGVAKARWVVVQLTLAAPDAQPSAALRAKIMDAAAKTPAEKARAALPTEKPKPSAERAMFPAWAWIAAAALALVTGYTIRQMNNQNEQLAELRKQMKLATMQNQSLQNQLDMDRMVAMVMMSPDSTPLKLMPKDKSMPMVHAYLHPHMGVAITADQMPSMPSARTLQLWFVPKSGKPMSVAIFHPDATGEIALVAPVNMPMNEIAELAVTEEPAGGSPQPTTPMAWMAQVN
ncbi:MAG TPA: anti-sigma factor [Candidatus Acidoferrales bacterium]|jgi:anti-sigma-K factor RskA|nr:anti-sigma factor [Candidatus Acidoferrales bacterium]